MRIGEGEIHVLIVACADGDHPRPEAILEGASAWFAGELDVNGLVEDLEAELLPDPFELDAKLSHFSWGADGVLLEIVIGVTAGVLGNRLDHLLEAVMRRARREEPGAELDAEDATRMAERFIARAKELDKDKTTVERVDRRSSSYLVTVAIAGERYEVEVPLRGGVSRFHRL
jgi:hypothetical protein